MLDEGLGAGQQRALMYGIAAGLVALALALFARSTAPDIAATPVVSSDGRLYYVLAVVAAIAFGVAQERAIEPVAGSAGGWILPAMTILATALLVGVYHRWAVVVAVPILVGSGVFAAALIGQVRAEDDDALQSSARVTHRILSTSVGLVSFAMVFIHGSGRTFTALAVGMVGGLLLYELL